MADVIVIGGVFREVLIDGKHRKVRLAGSGLYGALAAARGGASVALVAPVGEEDVPLAEALCAEWGVACHWLNVGPRSATFVVDAAWWRPARPQYKPVGGPVTEASTTPDAAPVVLVFGHPEWAPERAELLEQIVPNATLLWDRQGWLSRSQSWPDPAALGARQAVLLANLDEMAESWNVRPDQALDQPLPSSFQTAVVKDGPWGVHAKTSLGTVKSFAAHRVRARTSIGSGDVFGGALAAALATGSSIDEACRRGCLAAAEALASPDPLNPRPLEAQSMRPLCMPAVRSALLFELKAGEPWIAEFLASALADALGILFSPLGTSGGSGVTLTVRGSGVEPKTSNVVADSLPGMLGELIEVTLELVGEFATGALMDQGGGS